MNAEIIGIGSELLLGQIVNSDAQFISQQLSQLGINVFYHTVVGDNKNRILEALSIASGRSDIIITTGGLGPTMDDLSKETVAEFLGMEMSLHDPSYKHIKKFFEDRNKPIAENNFKQAMFPQEAIVLQNNRGTAPGAIMEKNKKVYIVLPGPPYELQPMFNDGVIPFLQKKSKEKIVSRVIRIYGLGESTVEERIKDLLNSQSNPTIAPLASYGEVTLRLTAKALTHEEGIDIIKPLEDEIVKRLGHVVYGFDDDSLESVVVGLLKKKNIMVAIAESCSGGQISNLITNVSGASDVFAEGFVTYSNLAKQKRLGVSVETIDSFGAVSEETAKEMAVGVRNTCYADIGLAVTGVAGPTGGTAKKPVGLVYMALADSSGSKAKEYRLCGDRLRIKHETAYLLLNWLRLSLLDIC